MKILITGGAGFIGSHLLNECLSYGHTVWVIDDLSGGKEENLKSDFELNIDPVLLAKIDIRNKDEVEKLFAYFEPEIVFHCAANAAENKAQFSPVDITSRNFGGSINILTSAIRHGVKRVIFTSSIAVYGAIQSPFKETDKPEPEDLYGITKLAFEDCLKVMAKVHEFEYVIARPHNVYGPRQNMRDPYRNVVTIFMNSLLKGEPYNIYGDGEQRRCFSYISDVVDALYNCAFKNVSGMTFNIGSDKDYSINQLSNIIQKVSRKKISPNYLSERPQEVKIAIADHTLSKKYLGYKEKVSLEEGIKKTWEYANSIGYQKPIYTELEINSKKVPVNWQKGNK